MVVITDTYRKLNAEKHRTSSVYGTSGHKYAEDVLAIVKSLNTQDILDYGCGKCTLGHSLPFPIKQYDPAIPKYEADPEIADIVVCTDVMEHIEPECLDDVIKHIHSKTRKFLYCSINTMPAVKTLADGRNAHLIVEDIGFWTTKFEKYFRIIGIMRQGNELIMSAFPLKKE